MIKQYIYITAALAVWASLAGCTESDEPIIKTDPARYITFGRPSTDFYATVGSFGGRAADSRAVELNAPVEKFRVWGFHQANDATGNPSLASIATEWNDKANFFTSGATVDNLKGNWVDVTVTDNTPQYGTQLTPWATGVGDVQYTFLAVAGPDDMTCTLDNASMSTSDAHGPRLTLTLPINVNNISTTRNPDLQPDVKVSWAFDRGPADSPIELNFKHIMTGIRFKFQNLTATDLRINSVTYSGRFYKQATYYFDSNKPRMTVNTAATQTYACTFDLFSGEQIINPDEADYMGVLAPADEPVTLLLLPNPAGTTEDDGRYTLGSQKIITINYQRKDESGNWGEEKNFSLGEDKALTLSYTPRESTIHTATFNFVGDGFIVAFQADNDEHWENGSDSNITIH